MFLLDLCECVESIVFFFGKRNIRSELVVMPAWYKVELVNVHARACKIQVLVVVALMVVVVLVGWWW